MSKLALEALFARMEKGGLDPVYFLNGDEEYLKIEFLKLLRKKLFGDHRASANVERVYAAAGSAPRIIDLASDYSLFSGGRLLVVYDIQRISESGQEMLISFFPRIPPGNHMVLFGPVSFDKRRKFYKYLTTEAAWSTLRGLSENSAPFWIRKRLSRHGFEITQGAIEQLVRYVGNSYGLLASQIDKLAVAIGDKKLLDVEDIERHTAVSAEYDVFKLLEAVDSCDTARALEILHRLIEKSDGTGSVMFWLGRQFSQYYCLTAGAGCSSEIASKLGVPPYRVESLREVARRKPVGYYEESIKAINRAEISLRFESIPQKIVLESLIIALTRRN